MAKGDFKKGFYLGFKAQALLAAIGIGFGIVMMTVGKGMAR